MGFAVPLSAWFRGPLRDRVRNAVLGERLADTAQFSRRYLEHLVSAHQSGAKDYSAPLWSLLMFDAFLGSLSSGRHSDSTPGDALEGGLVVSAAR
jgi:asparagine synthase (glutamine-hydrolysing)